MSIAKRIAALFVLVPNPVLLAACDDPGTSNPGAQSDTAADTASDKADDPDTIDTSESPETIDTLDTTPVDTAPPPECTVDGDCGLFADRPLCNKVTTRCEALPAGHLIGWRDGSAASVTLTEIYRPSSRIEATDLEFHPERDELWVLNRRFEVGGLCTESNPNSTRCRSLGSKTTIVFEPGTANQDHVILEDENSWHFMRRAPALAMGVGETFATCGEAATGNFEDDPFTYIGPTLWSTDLDIYTQPSGGNGSHLDMLHETPFCMGIAHERDNVFWLFNGDVGAIDRIDFHSDHGPGADDHDDGEVHRYVEGALLRVPNVPSHMVFNPGDAHLYVADSGHQRIVKLDTQSGTQGGQLDPVWEILEDSGEIDDAVLSEVVPPGRLFEPSGLALHDGVLYVTDHATSRFHAFDLSGQELRTLETGLPAGTLAGVTVGRDGRIWFVDMLEGAVFRIDPL